MYRAKTDRNRKVEVFDATMQDALRETTELEGALRTALDSDEFHLNFQPIVDVSLEKIIGYEALLRWKHSERGLVPPDEFIPAAEEIGLISSIGLWVIEQACMQVAEWSSAGGLLSNAPFVAVNLSAKQLVDPGLAQKVSGILNKTGLEATRLHLEITETALVREQEQIHRTLADLRQLGCRLSADDFGTGYSSLTYLQRYEFDSFKIDKRFVQDIDHDGAGKKLCKALIGLADDLDLKVIAEGVETLPQQQGLRQMGCTLMQGYFFSHPLAKDRIERIHRQNLSNHGSDITRLRAVVAG